MAGKINEHSKTRLRNCKGRLPKGVENLEGSDWIYWCPNRKQWLIKPCDCDEAYWNNHK